MHLSVIVPVYNEEKTLYKNIFTFYEYLAKQNYDFEIIVVNDGSRDGTVSVVGDIKKKIPLVFVNNNINKGKGAVVREGLLLARGDFRLFIDADNATTIEHLDLVWPSFNEGKNLVIGTRNSRDIEGAKQNVPQVFWKRFLGISGNLLIQKILVSGIWDTQCGFKVFEKEFVEKILPKTKTNRWATDIEILALAIRENYQIGKIPVNWNNSDYSRVGIAGYISALKEVAEIKKNLLLGRYN